MSDSPSLPPALSVSTYVEEGARIAAILSVWAIISVFFTFALTEIGVFARVFQLFGGVFALAGVLNAVVYVLYRTVDYWHWRR